LFSEMLVWNWRSHLRFRSHSCTHRWRLHRSGNCFFGATGR